jgi:hypothetical protein
VTAIAVANAATVKIRTVFMWKPPKGYVEGSQDTPPWEESEGLRLAPNGTGRRCAEQIPSGGYADPIQSGG